MEEAESCKIGKLAVMSLSVVAGVKIPDLLFWKGKKKNKNDVNYSAQWMIPGGRIGGK